MPTPAARKDHERWLCELTAIPTAAGQEGRVIAWVEAWVRERGRSLRLRRDRTGNLVITPKTRRPGRPIFLQAHLDHPAFVVRRVVDDRHVELEFRGGVHDGYFDRATIEIFDADDVGHAATITEVDAKAKPFKRVTARLARAAPTLAPDDIGRWKLRDPLPRVERGLLYTHACDDLAAVAAALAALDELRRRRTLNIGVLLTRAEEIGFIGTLAACENRSVPRTARIICLENSRSFSDSPIGAGPILRVGDKMSVFSPTLTNRIDEVLALHRKRHADFRWQRKLMPGGSCEATAFSVYGYESTCLCLPLGNYHNMADIDGALAGAPARVGPEHIALADYHGLVEMLVVSASTLDTARTPSTRARLDALLDRHRHLVEPARRRG